MWVNREFLSLLYLYENVGVTQELWCLMGNFELSRATYVSLMMNIAIIGRYCCLVDMLIRVGIDEC